MTRPAAVAVLVLAVVVGVVAVATAKPPKKTEPAVRAGERATAPGRISSGGLSICSQRSTSYWRAHCRLTVAQHALGRAHAELRRLRRQAATRTLQARTDTKATIRLVFWKHGDEAVRVADCETGGTFSPWAKNGRYENLFQMGYDERKKYGWHTVGSPALVATLAAYRYFLATGSDWSPWSCKP